MSKLKSHPLLIAFFLISALAFIFTNPICADEEVDPGFVGTEQREPSVRSHSQEENAEDDSATISPSAKNLFDDSEYFTPLDFLPVVDTDIKHRYIEKNAEGENVINEEMMAEDLETISISPNGQIDTVPADDYEVEDLKTELMKAINASESRETEYENNMSEADEGDYEMESDRQLVGSVIGGDMRRRIINTRAYPYRTVGHIDIGCTGTLIGKHHILTAGHCVYNISNDKWYSKLNVSLGQNGSSRPYGTTGWEKAICVKGWTKSHKRDYDYAMIVLKSDIGNTVGWMGYGWNSSMPRYLVNISGYPADKSPVESMWYSRGKLKIVTPYRLYHDCDTFPGNSGSGIYLSFPPRSTIQTICGIHAYGVDSTGYNSGTRITQTVFNNLSNWKANN